MERVSWKECNTGFLGRESILLGTSPPLPTLWFPCPLHRGGSCYVISAAPSEARRGLHCTAQAPGVWDSSSDGGTLKPHSNWARRGGRLSQVGKIGGPFSCTSWRKDFLPHPQAAHLARRLGISPGKGPCHSLKGYHCFHSC